MMDTYVQKDAIAIDMTMGNGFDTLHLAQKAKHVYAFDIQDEALLQTKEKLDKENISNVTLIKDSHENILNYVSTFDYVVFNLGYLPKGNKEITTKTNSTLLALDHVLSHINDGGYIQIMIYPGHAEGFKESLALNEYFKTLNPLDYKILRIDLPYQNNQPPYLVLIHKIKKDGR
ncbi:MAG: methyltransferase domain-containing protein [Bacillota bacterium]|nr:MAG: methyltransferase domain-containing protein [Bacillota bacterium]